jgi:predicted NACHT family NTPase
MKKIIVLLLFCFWLSSVVFAQDSIKTDTIKPTQNDLSKNERQVKTKEADWTKILLATLAVVSLSFGIYQYLLRRRDTADKAYDEAKGQERFKKEKEKKQSQNKEQAYKDFLTGTLGTIGILGATKVKSLEVKLFDSFITLALSETFHSDEKYKKQPIEKAEDHQFLIPEKVVERAFTNQRMLLIVGDPGSGKTTLLKYFAISCINQNHNKFGYSASQFPIFLPLRFLDFSNGQPDFCAALASYSNLTTFEVTDLDFRKWAAASNVLILLDGLDEIADDEQRKKACKWIADVAKRHTKAKFIVTSRWTGIDKEKYIDIPFPYQRADVRELSFEQKSQFLKKWFRAAAKSTINPPQDHDNELWQTHQLAQADEQADLVISFLKDPKNKSLNELASTPMILQIIALLKREKNLTTANRNQLYSATMHYMLQDRDEEKEIKLPMDINATMDILKPTAYWMQSDIKSEEVSAEELDKFLKKPLKEYNVTVNAFLTFLCKRAGILIDYDKISYIFRHKSFREFFVGERIADYWQDEKLMREVAGYIGDEWWKEPIRFFMSRANRDQFDAFMKGFMRTS